MKCIYIDGNLLIKEHSLFYTSNLVQYADSIPVGADIIIPEDGTFVLEPGDVFGSPFYECHVSGGVTGYGNSETRVDRDLMVEIFKEKMGLISTLLSMNKTEGDIQQLFLQEQYMAIYSLIEYYLLSLIYWGIQDENRFHHLLTYDYSSVEKTKYNAIYQISKIAKRTDIGENDKFAEIVSKLKKLVYHRIDTVEMLYKIIFGIDCRSDLSILNGAFIDRRNDFAHRIGCNKNMIPVPITKEEVETLINEANNLCTAIYNKVKVVVEK